MSIRKSLRDLRRRGYDFAAGNLSLTGADSAIQAYQAIVTGLGTGAGQVGEDELEDGAVTGDKIASGAVTSGKIGALAVGTAALATGGVTNGKLGADAVDAVKAAVYPFNVVATITSAAAATPVSLLADGAVPAGKKVYLQGFVGHVNGGTNWATTATVKIQDTNGTPVDFVTMAVAALTGNAIVYPGTANITSESAFADGTGGTAAKGLQLVGNANGTGSDLIVRAWGVIAA